MDIEGPAKGPTKNAKRSEPAKEAKKEEMRHGGSKSNNRINERDLKTAKDKDCVIYWWFESIS